MTCTSATACPPPTSAPAAGANHGAAPTAATAWKPGSSPADASRCASPPTRMAPLSSWSRTRSAPSSRAPRPASPTICCPDYQLGALSPATATGRGTTHRRLRTRTVSVSVQTVKEGVMSKELGAWLRQQRQARGLSRPEMARRLIQAAEARDDKSVPGLDSVCHNLYRWERGADGLSERYKLYCCQVLGIPPAQFGPGQPEAGPGAAHTPGTITLAIAPGLPATPLFPQAPYLVSGPADPALLPPAAVAYRGMQEPGMGDSAIRQEVLMAAHEGSERAEQAEQRGIGDTTLEQFRADLTRLSREYMTGEPLPLFLEMRRVRGRMHDALDRRVWPGDARDLYFLLGCINGLMAILAKDLGYLPAAEELARAGWVYAIAIDHKPLLARLSVTTSDIAYQN